MTHHAHLHMSSLHHMKKQKKAVAELNYKKHDDVLIRLIMIDEEGKKNILNNNCIIVIRYFDLDIEKSMCHVDMVLFVFMILKMQKEWRLI